MDRRTREPIPPWTQGIERLSLSSRNYIYFDIGYNISDPSFVFKSYPVLVSALRSLLSVTTRLAEYSVEGQMLFQERLPQRLSARVVSRLYISHVVTWALYILGVIKHIFMDKDEKVKAKIEG